MKHGAVGATLAEQKLKRWRPVRTRSGAAFYGGAARVTCRRELKEEPAEEIRQLPAHCPRPARHQQPCAGPPQPPRSRSSRPAPCSTRPLSGSPPCRAASRRLPSPRRSPQERHNDRRPIYHRDHRRYGYRPVHPHYQHTRWVRSHRHNGPTYGVSHYGYDRLRPPPRGNHWARADNDSLLAAITTGVILTSRCTDTAPRAVDPEPIRAMHPRMARSIFTRCRHLCCTAQRPRRPGLLILRGTARSGRPLTMMGRFRCCSSMAGSFWRAR